MVESLSQEREVTGGAPDVEGWNEVSGDNLIIECLEQYATSSVVHSSRCTFDGMSPSSYMGVRAHQPWPRHFRVRIRVSSAKDPISLLGAVISQQHWR